MAPPSKVSLLPDEVRREFESRLIRGAFAGYEQLSDWLATQGYEIGKTALHKHGQKLKRRLEAIKASTQAAQLLAESAPDEAGALSSAVLSLVQTEMFELLVSLQEVDDAEDAGARVKLLGNAAHAMADLARASLKQKEWAAGIKAKLDALLAETQRGETALDIRTLQRIRSEVYGLAA